MRFSFFPIFLLLSTFSFAQQLSIDTGTTRALIVGVSNYEDDRLTDLNFAHRDAEIFADYLKSTAGGNVDPGNIVLLTNEAATKARINEEMRKLKDNAAEDDLVIFYFSGHGDKETGMETEIGYLLAHDTPMNNYRGNAVDLYYLNSDAYEISVGKKAKFVIILDACHSGQLAGDDVDGRINLSKNVKLTSGSEIRILSCQSDQKSLEVSDLDGGRGLFSYYLVRGLIGEAEEDEDLQVTKDELETYLQKNIKREAKKRDKNQYPEITGKYDFRLSFVDEEALAALKTEDLNNALDEEMMAMADRGVEKSAEGTENSSKKLYEPFDIALQEKKLLYPVDSSAYYFYNKLLNENPKDKRLSTLKSQLIVVLQDEAQKAINAYLRGDQLELNRRIYISDSEDYTHFPIYLEKAAELVGKDYPTYKEILAKQFYFKGINARLEAAKTGYNEANLEAALSFQKEALRYEANAAYIHNEIGLIHFYLKNYETAERKYQKAIEFSPTWAIPYSNLSALYLNQVQYEKAKQWGQKAVELQPDLLNPNINLGSISGEQQNYLKAEEYYRHALKLNWDHFLAFERLAYTYTLMGDYALADHLFKEADIRKKDVFPQIIENVTSLEGTDVLAYDPIIFESEQTYLDRIAENPFDYQAWHTLGQLYVTQDRKEEAEACFKKAIDIKPDMLTVYHDLGGLFTSWGRYLEAIATYETILKKDISVAPKIWSILEDLKRFDETEDMIKKYSDAKTLFDFYSRMLVIFPDLATYWYKRGLLLYEEKEAGYYFWGWLGITSDTKTTTFAWDRNTAITTTKPDFDQWTEFWGTRAISDFEKALELDPDHPSKVDIYLKLGEMYQLWSTLYEEDVFIETRIRNSREDSTQLRIYHGFLSMMQKAIENSEKAYELEKLEVPNKLPWGDFHTESPDQIDPLHQLIDQYLINFEYEKALALLDTLVANDQFDFDNRQKLMRIYILTNQMDNAKAMLDWTFERPFGKFEYTHVLQGLYYRLNEDYQKAIENYEKALQPIVDVIDIEKNEIAYFTPVDFVSYKYKIATLHALGGDEKQALKMLEDAIESGFDFKKVLAYDPDLDNIRSSKKFEKLISKYNLENETPY